MKTAFQIAGGQKGEDIARRFLEHLGFTIIETNYRFGHGEIDIIAREGEFLVFCEVKARWNDRYGEPEYAITARKQSQVRKVAEGYLFERAISEQACRFDVIAIRFRDGKPTINHMRNAF